MEVFYLSFSFPYVIPLMGLSELSINSKIKFISTVMHLIKEWYLHLFIEHLPCAKHCWALFHEVSQEIFTINLKRYPHFIDKDPVLARLAIVPSTPHVAQIGVGPGPSDLSVYFYHFFIVFQ